MNRSLKTLFLISIGFVLLVVMAALMAPRFIQTDVFKKNLELYLSKRVGRDIRISGELVARFMPWVGFRVTKVELADANGFDAGPMGTCEMADVRIELFPLLEKRIVFKEVFLDQISVRLIRNKDGKTNWEDLIAVFANSGQMPEIQPQPVSGPFVLDRIGEVRIRRSTLVFRDEPRQISAKASNLSFDRQGMIQREFRLDGKLEVNGPLVAGFHKVNGRLKMAGNSYLDVGKFRLAIIDSALSFPFELADRDGQSLRGELAAKVAGDTRKKNLTLSEMSFRLDKTTVTGALRGTGLLDHPSVSGRLSISTPDAASLIRQVHLTDSPAAFWAPAQAVSISLAGMATPGKAVLDHLTVKTAQTDFAGRMTVEKGAGGQIAGRLKTELVDVDRLFPHTSTDEADEKPIWMALKELQWELDLELSVGRIRTGTQEVEDFQSHVAIGEGRAVFRPASLTYAGGKVQGGLDAVLVDEEVLAKATVDFRDIPSALLWPEDQKPANVTGKITGRMDLISEGASWADLAKTLSGTMRIEAPQGLVIASDPGAGKNAVHLDRALVVLAAYVHGENSSENGADLSRSYSIDIEADLQEPKIQGRIKSNGIFRLTPDATALSVSATQFEAGFSGPGLGLLSPVAIDGAGLFESRSGRLAFDNLSFQGLGVTGSGRVAANAGQWADKMTGHVKINNFDPRRLAARLGIILPVGRDPLVFQHARAEADFAWDREKLWLNQAAVVVDDTRLGGDISLSGPKLARIDFVLNGDRIDLDRYFPPDQGSKTAPASPASGQHQAEREIELHGKLTLGTLKAAQIRIKEPELSLDLADGILELGLQQSTLYNGSAAGDAVLDLAASPPKGTATLLVGNVTLSGLLEDLFQWVPITGAGTMHLNVAGSGADLTAWIKSLNGKALVTIDNGAIQGVRMVPDRVRDPKDRAGAKDPKQEPFDRIQGTVFIENGVLKSSDAKLTASSVQATGAGILDLNTLMLDYAMTADIRGLPVVNYTFTGHLDDIAVSLDRVGFATEAAKGVLKSPFRLGKGTLDIGTEILGAGQEIIGDRTGAQRMGQGALNVGKGILDLGKGLFSLDGKAGDTLTGGAKEVGNGLLDVGKGVVDTGQDVLEGIGGGLKKIFSGGKEKTKENQDMEGMDPKKDNDSDHE